VVPLTVGAVSMSIFGKAAALLASARFP